MSLSAILAQPVRNSRRPAHRPRAADAPARSDHLKALKFRMVLGLTEREAAGALGITRITLRRWCKLAYGYPEGKQMVAEGSSELPLD
jgi:predicted DNA-binding protein (UPF0251 family)